MFLVKVRLKNDGTLMQGRVGDDLTSEQGKLAARQVGVDYAV